MDDLRESFPSLEDVSTEEGKALGARIEGDSPTSVNGSIGFSFKDSAGDLVLPQLNASGQLPVSLDATGDNLHARGENLAGSGSLVTIATITLTASKTYQGIEVLVSCFRESIFYVIQNDNAALTTLMDLPTGPGQFSMAANMEKIEFTAGAVGTQQLLVKAINNTALSALRVTIATKQIT